jgi:hypothetical protein
MSKATLFETHESSMVLIVNDGNLAYPNTSVTIEGCNRSAIANGIVRMINENQCSECGKFNGLHGEVFHVTDMDNGEVRGKYLMCSKGIK